MPNKPLARICVRLWKEDYDCLKQVTKDEGALNLLIRALVHNYAMEFRDRQASAESAQDAYRESLSAIGIKPHSGKIVPMEL